MMHDTPLQKVLSAVESVTGKPAKRNGRGWLANCPAHHDDNASLSIAEGDDGRALVRCFAGCSFQSIMSACGLEPRDAMPEKHSSPKPRPMPASKPAPKFESMAAAISAMERTRGKSSHIYTYHDGHGEPCGAVLRWDTPNGKTIRQLARNGDGWTHTAMPEPRPLYRLPELSEADVVVVAEGEKAADAAASLGFTATTSPGGSKAAHKSDWKALHGKRAVLLSDNDDAGRKYAATVAQTLLKHDAAADVRIVELPGLAKGEDVVEFIAAHGADEARRQIEQLTAAAPRVELESAPSSVHLVRLCDVQPVPKRWLWPERIALGKLTLLVGDPGLGKSFLTLDLAARISRGGPWPDDLGRPQPVGGVVLLSAEDDLGDTIRPRLDGAGADVQRIAALMGVREPTPEAGTRPFNLAADLDRLEYAIQSTADCRLVVIDPITAYLGSVDSHKNADIRGLLAPLASMAAAHGVAVVAVSHLNKAANLPAIYRAMGSLAFVAAARATWSVVRDREDPTGARRLFLPIKNNLGNDRTGLAFRLAPSEYNSEACIAWERDPVNVQADAAMGPDTDGEAGAVAEAKAWLEAMLAAGPVKAKDVKTRATTDGIAHRTLDRAKTALGVVAGPSSYGGPWVWRLAVVEPAA